MTLTASLFLAFTAGLALAMISIAARHLRPRAAALVAIGLALWLAYVGGLAASGLIRDATLRPPAVLYIVGPAALFILLVVARSRGAGVVAATIPLWILIAAQTFRIGVELFLRQLWIEGLVPKMLTFEGANVDVWIGLSAPLAAWLSTRRSGGVRVALAWNIVGLLALANVVVRSALTAPGPLHLLDAELANRAIGTFPYTYVAGFFAPLALTLHVLALRAIASRRSPPSPERILNEPARRRP